MVLGIQLVVNLIVILLEVLARSPNEHELLIGLVLRLGILGIGIVELRLFLVWYINQASSTVGRV